MAIQINLTPASVIKEGSWLDLPMAIIMLQAAGVLPELPEHEKGDFIMVGEVGLWGSCAAFPGSFPSPTWPSPARR